MSSTKPRYGKEILGKRVKLQTADGKRWRTATVSGYHGGYLRHTVTFDDNEEQRQMHLYQEEYKFIHEETAGTMPDLLLRTISVQSPTGQRVSGEVIHYDGLMHTVRQSDGSTQHFNLRQQAYKVTNEHSTRDANGGGGRGPSRRTSEAEKDPHPQDSAGNSAGKKVKQQTSPSTNSAGVSGSSKAAAAAVQGKDRKPVADTRADGTAKPPRRAAADRAAAVAVAVSMGGNGGLHGREEEKHNRRPAPTPKGGAGAFAGTGGARRGGGGGDGGVEPARKLPPLNMSHVSKKDREAARMLLTFSTPTAQEAQASAQPFGEAARPGAAGTGALEAASSRTAIAAMAQAAAAAAGLPDPAAVEDDDEPLSPVHIDDSLGDGPALALAAAAAAAALAGAEKAAEAAADGIRHSASPAAPGVAAAGADALAAAEAAAAAAEGAGGAGKAPGSSIDGALMAQVLTSLQRQMQKLIALEERRSVDIVRLNAKVARLQDERDDAFREREAALAEREVAAGQVQELEEENTTLSTRVDLLQREVAQLQAHISIERDMVSNLSLDAAALQMQLAGIRNELGCCQAESSQLLVQFRGLNGADSSDGVAAYDSGPADAAAAAAAMMSLSGAADMQGKDRPGHRAVYGQKPGKRGPASAAAAAAGGMPEMDPAAAAALPVPAEAIGMQAGHVRPPMQPLMPFRSMTEARTLNVGQLMQVGPGKLVVGPRGWKPAPVLPPPAPVQTKQHGGRHKRRRGQAAKLAAQRKREQAAAAAAAAAAAGDASAAAAAEGAAAAAEAAGTEEDEHDDTDVAEAGGDEQSDDERDEEDREKATDPRQQQQGDSGSGAGGSIGRGPATDPNSRDVSSAACTAADAQPQATGSKGPDGPPQQQQQLQAGSAQELTKGGQQQQQQQAMQPRAHNAAAERGSRSPTPDKCQQADQDSSNGPLANKKRKRDEPKASVLAEGSSGAPALTMSQMLAARVAAAAAAAAGAAPFSAAAGPVGLGAPRPALQQQQGAVTLGGGMRTLGALQGGTTLLMRPGALKPPAAAAAAAAAVTPAVPAQVVRPAPAAAVPANIAREALQAAKRMKTSEMGGDRPGSLPLQQGAAPPAVILQ